MANNPLFTQCYLITQTENKSLHLLDPSQTPTTSRPLQLWPRHFAAFCLPDGRLRIVELVSEPSKTRLCWHAISLVDGSMMISEQKHFWPRTLPGLKVSLIHHAGSSKVFGFVDSHTMAIMHADTLHEITRIHIMSRHPQHIKEGFGLIADLAWSHTGAMIAVTWRGGRHVTPAEAASDRRTQLYAGPPIVSEVHVFDTSNGYCLQSIAVSAGSIKLCWSPGTDVLAVYSRQDDWSGDEQVLRYPIEQESESDSEGNDEGAYRIPRFLGQIRLLRPLQAQLHVLDSQQKDHSQAQWTRCDWSPQGHLLVTQWVSNSAVEAAGFAIIDSVTCKTVFEADQPAGNTSWAEQSSSLLQGPCLVAFLSGASMAIRLSRPGDGDWRAVPCTCSAFSPGSKVYTSPDGQKLVGLQFSLQALGRDRICHVALRSTSFSQEQSLYLEGPYPGAKWDITFAPFSFAWPALYAYIHPSSKAGQAEQQALPSGRARAVGPLMELSLVDCKRNAVLDSWTAQDLWERSTEGQPRASGCRNGATLRLHSAKWSPNRRHLAVTCDRCTMVMTFDGTC